MSPPQEPRGGGLDDYRRYLFRLARYGRGQTKDQVARLRALETLFLEAWAEHDPGRYRLPKHRLAAWDRLGAAIGELAASYASVSTKEAGAIYREIAGDAAGIATRNLNHVMGANVFTGPSGRSKAWRTMLDERIVENVPDREWWKTHARGIADDWIAEIRGHVRAGVKAADIVDPDNATNMERFWSAKERHATGRVQTLVSQAHNDGAVFSYESVGTSVISGLEQHAALDSRTCRVCSALDGQVWTREDGSYQNENGYQWGPPPNNTHRNCRCTVLPVLVDYEDMPADIRRKVPAQKRAALGGSIDSRIHAEDWLKDQPIAVQRDILGVGVQRLWASGQVSFQKLVGSANAPLSLAELRDT